MSIDDFHDMAVLIVDDEIYIRDIIKKILTPLNVSCYEAGQGVEALTILSKHKIDLMITDIMMPVMDGRVLLEKAKEREPNLITLILTAHGDKQTLLKAIEMRVFDFLEKPFSPELVLNRVINALRYRRQKKNLDLAMREFICSYCKVATKEDFDKMSEIERNSTIEAGLGVLKIKNINMAA